MSAGPACGESTSAGRIVAAARGAVGARFRMHGREIGFGVDCVGLAGLALRAGGFTGEIPGGYAPRGGDAGAIEARMAASGLVRGDAAVPGDVMLFETGPGQLHFAILVPGGFVHADAMLRRVVERPGRAPWRVIGAWRMQGD